MPVEASGDERKGKPRVSDDDPGPLQRRGRRLFRDDADCTTADGIADEGRAVGTQTLERDEDVPWANMARVVRDAGHVCSGTCVHRFLNQAALTERFLQLDPGHGCALASVFDGTRASISEHTPLASSGSPGRGC